MAKVAPQAPEAGRWLDAALAAQEAGRLTEALAAYEQLLTFAPEHVLGWNNLANLLRQSGRCLEAETAYRRALEWALARAPVLTPESALERAQIYANWGGVLEDLGRLAEAEAAYRHAVALAPEWAPAQFNLGLLLLSQGRYAEGWHHYEARKAVFAEHGTLPFPEWQGECLQGRSLLLLPEQGYGDTLQFVRYARLLKERGVAHLSLLCADALAPLLQTQTAIDHLITRPETLYAHDFWISLASLPYRFGTLPDTIAAPPYLKVPAEREALWRDCLPPAAWRVGLAWKGSAWHENDAHRSLPHFSVLQPLWSLAGVQGVQFVSLQKGEGEGESEACAAQQPVIAAGAALRDFADTAALVAQMDLIVSVDTALAHLAGALNVPCWVMLPRHGVDWRWLRHGEHTPWYSPSLRLFRQQEAGDWRTVVDDIALQLRRLR